MSEYYVGNISGSDYSGATFVTGIYDDLGDPSGDYHISAGSAFTDAASGDYFYVDDDGSANITTDYYKVYSVDPSGDWITLSSSAGSDATDVKLVQHSGLNNTGDEFRTINKGARYTMDNAVSPIHLYVQSGTAYNEGVTVYTEEKSLYITGYASVIGDEGLVEMDGTSSSIANGIRIYKNHDGNYTYGVQNFYIHDYSGHGIYFTSTAGSAYTQGLVDNCYISNVGGVGVYVNNAKTKLSVWRTVASNCGSYGFRNSSTAEPIQCIACKAYNNGSTGFFGGSRNANAFIYCISANNNGWGFAEVGTATNCIANNNSGGGYATSVNHDWINTGPSMFIACGATNNGGWGIDPYMRVGIINCGFYNNTSGPVDTGANRIIINVGSITGIDPGYTDTGNYDFTLNSQDSAWAQQDMTIGVPASGTISYVDIGAAGILQTGSSSGGAPVIKG